MFDPEPSNFVSPAFYIRHAVASWEKAGAEELRRQIFVREQAVFEEHDRDEIDGHATTLVAISTVAHEPDEIVGTVRIHEAEDGVWWGSRLAVRKDFRCVGRLGAELIRLAVSTATTRGCHMFLAYVQTQNVLLFRRLRWDVVESDVTIHGVTHARMKAQLHRYPPLERPAEGWLSLPKRALAA
ncbi:MAG: MSMEG_0567/Sll0786 family nitrogen starvation N-acetyltransferase [Pseudomonadota bacterium]